MIINIKEDVTKKLNIEPIVNSTTGDYMFGGAVPAIIDGIIVGKTNAHTKGEFAGLELPTLEFTFKNFKLLPDEPDRYCWLVEKIIGTVQKDKDNPEIVKPRSKGDIEKNINEMWARIRHILDACKLSPNYRDISSIPSEHVGKYFDLPADGKIEDRIKAFEGFFKYLSMFVNGDGQKLKPIYHTHDGLGIPVWMIVVPDFASGAFYTIPTFVEKGFIEPMTFDANGKFNLPKVIRVSPNTNLKLVSKKAVMAKTQSLQGQQSIGSAVPTDLLAMMRAGVV